MANFGTPNLQGQFYIGDVMAAAPAAMNEFEHHLTDQKNATKVVEGSNEINSTDENIYGAKSSIEIVLGSKRSYSVTVLVKVDASEGSLFSKIRGAYYDPTGDIAKVSYLARTLDPETMLPLDKDYFCPEATMQVDMDPGFGTAGELTEVSLTFSELVAGELVDAIPGAGETVIPMPPTLTTAEDYLVLDVTHTKTVGDLVADLGAVALSGDGETVMTGSIAILDKDGEATVAADPIPAVPGIYTYILNIEEGSGVNKKADKKAVSVLVNTGGAVPTAKKK